MPLMRAHRHRLGAIVMALLVLVMVGALMPDPMGTQHPSTPPADRFSFSAWRSYFSDNFGYARSMPFLRGVIQYALGTSSDPRVFIGQHAHLYYNAENVVGQATGSVYRSEEVEHFVAVADALSKALAAWGGHLVVELPPNAQSVATQDLPSWWHVSGPLEYDLAMRELRERDITTVDLKSALAAMPDAVELYRRVDTHWRWKAALLAYDMTMRAIGHGEWSVDPAAAFSPLAPVQGGDLARLIGLQDYLSDEDYPLRLPQEVGWKPIDVIRSPPYAGLFDPYAFERGDEGERLLVLGDSFTAGLWRPFLLHSGASRIGWMHHALCGFDFSDVARFRPTYVILAPTERAMPCGPKRWPRGLPR